MGIGGQPFHSDIHRQVTKYSLCQVTKKILTFVIKITTPSEAKKSSDYQNSSAVVPVMKYTNHCNKTISVKQMKSLTHFQIIHVS